MTVTVQQQLLDTLKKIDRPGMFCTSGRLPSTFPGLDVASLGTVALPLEKRQAAALKKLARQAPYGKGARTLVDTDVRRVWEIDAEQVALTNPEWQNVLKQAIGAVQSSLGLEEQKLAAHLYKLLLYEPGSFFRAHRDGEKLDRMVATLVIALPSAHEGGELVVRHEGREQIVNFGPESRFQTQFAAFYADCEHEIRPVTSGYRLALVYNLTLEKSKRTITAPTNGEQIAEVTRLFCKWSGQRPAAVDKNNESVPSKLAVLLEHQYSQAGLTCDALKGIDRAQADVLFAAAREAGCDASLALVTYWESGSAEPSGDYGYGSRRRRRYERDNDDDDDECGSEHSMGELYDSSLTVEHFSDADGNALAYGQIPLDDDEIVSKQPLTEGKPDKENFEGYTGNAGMTLERWYHRAAILLWPGESRFDVLCEAGVEAAVGGLEQMVRRWKQAKQSEQQLLKPPCLEFASRIIAHWPERKFASGYYSANYGYENQDDDDDFDDEGEDRSVFSKHGDPADRAAANVSIHPLLSLLEELCDISLIAAWLRGVLAKDASVDPGRTLGDLCEQHGWTTFQDELRELFESTTGETLERHARLLADWSLRKDQNADCRRFCSQLAQQILSVVERWDPQRTKRDWQARIVDLPALLPPLVQAFLVLEELELFERLITYVRDRPKEFDLTTVQLPALLSLEAWLKGNVKRSSPPLRRWLTAAIEELGFRESHPPQKPADWQRESATGCDCADCQELGRFLEDPNTQTCRFPLVEQRRRHIHQIIDGKKLDTTHVTERRGRPYTLVCTKTRASYERALQAHRVDLDHLAKIRELTEWHEELKSDPVQPGRDAPKPKRRR
ncbi:MAG: 2OG-Fe(II) oxygenase [Planctomycetaceae bacterium]|nr:2OG-Fe(II) oxygenase [Planctomycetaceae bacterium]